MSLVTAVSAGLHGALLLARGRADGAQLVETDMQGAARSFWALPVCLPTVICLRLIDWAGGGLPRDAGHQLARDIAVFVVGWLLFAVITWKAAARIQRASRWPHFIAAWNWCNVVENLLVVLGSIPGLLGAPHVVSQVAILVTLGWALWLEWYAARLTLAAGPLLAVLVVLLDQMIGQTLMTIALLLSGS
jgi:uncharacterized membrane protein